MTKAEYNYTEGLSDSHGRITSGSDHFSSKRINDTEEIKNSYFGTVLSDILRAIEGGSLMGAFVLSFCSIDYLAQLRQRVFPVVGASYGDIYRNHVIGSKYLKRSLKPSIPDYLWAIRCALVHSYGKVDNKKITPHFTHNNSQHHLTIKRGRSKKPTVTINLDDLVTDIILDADAFLSEYKSREQDLINWYDEIIRPVGRIEVHECLSSFLSNPDKNRAALLSFIQSLYP